MALGVDQVLVKTPTYYSSFIDTVSPHLKRGAEKIEAALDYTWGKVIFYGPKAGRWLLRGLERSFSYGWNQIITHRYETTIVITSIVCFIIAQRVFRYICSFLPGSSTEKQPPRDIEEPTDQPSTHGNK